MSKLRPSTLACGPFEGDCVSTKGANRLASYQQGVVQQLLKPFRPEDSIKSSYRATDRTTERPGSPCGRKTTSSWLSIRRAFVTFKRPDIKANGLQHFFSFPSALFRLDLFFDGMANGKSASGSGVQCFRSPSGFETLPPSSNVPVPRPANVWAMVTAPNLPASATNLGFLVRAGVRSNVMRKCPFGQHLAEQFRTFRWTVCRQEPAVPIAIGFFTFSIIA